MRFARKLLLALVVVLLFTLVVALADQKLPHPDRRPYSARTLELHRRS
jgi:hypothetical protein